MKIKNKIKFPKEEEGNKIIKLEYRTHDKNSTVQFLNNFLFVHNFTNENTLILDFELKAKEKLVCSTKNILSIFLNKTFYKLMILDGNILGTCQLQKDKGQNELTEKLYSLNVGLENLFK